MQYNIFVNYTIEMNEKALISKASEEKKLPVEACEAIYSKFKANLNS